MKTTQVTEKKQRVLARGVEILLRQVDANSKFRDDMESLIKRISDKETRMDLTDQLDDSINDTRKLCAKFNIDSVQCPQLDRHGTIQIPRDKQPMIQMQSKIEEECENFRIGQQLKECKEMRKSMSQKFFGVVSDVSRWKQKVTVIDEPQITLHDALMQKNSKKLAIHNPFKFDYFALNQKSIERGDLQDFRDMTRQNLVQESSVDKVDKLLTLNGMLSTERAQAVIKRRKEKIPLFDPTSFKSQSDSVGNSPIKVRPFSPHNGRIRRQMSTTLMNPTKKLHIRSLTETNLKPRLHHRLIYLGQTGSQWLGPTKPSDIPEQKIVHTTRKQPKKNQPIYTKMSNKKPLLQPILTKIEVTPSKRLRDGLEIISHTLDVKENRIFLQNVIPTKSLYSVRN